MGSCRIAIGIEAVKNLRSSEIPVVIDNLRASSTVVTALAHGIEEIVPVSTANEALFLKKQEFLTAGESDGIKLPGFDIGNSPVELLQWIRKKPVKRLALKTSNLTPLLLKLKGAWICSSLNLKAVANHLLGKNTCIIAVGGEKGVSEDLSVAVMLFARFSNVKMDETLLKHFIKESHAAQYLSSIGYLEDVKLISCVNIFDVLPYFDGRIIKSR